jgi:hypothetical protein
MQPNTPCSRPRWRGRELGASRGRKLRRSSGCLPAWCLSLDLRDHSTARRRTSAVCWCCAVPRLVALQTAASGAANGHDGGNGFASAVGVGSRSVGNANTTRRINNTTANPIIRSAIVRSRADLRSFSTIAIEHLRNLRISPPYRTKSVASTSRLSSVRGSSALSSSATRASRSSGVAYAC